VLAPRRDPAACGLAVEPTVSGSAEEGTPLLAGKQERPAIGVLAVADGHETGQVGGHLDALAALTYRESPAPTRSHTGRWLPHQSGHYKPVVNDCTISVPCSCS
jgi:hypothetical protein